jgi:uncharacterized membrane protein
MKKTLVMLLVLSILLIASFVFAENFSSALKIDSPGKNEIFNHEEVITFIGSGIDLKDGELPDTAIVWKSDTDFFFGVCLHQE